MRDEKEEEGKAELFVVTVVHFAFHRLFVIAKRACSSSRSKAHDIIILNIACVSELLLMCCVMLY